MTLPLTGLFHIVTIWILFIQGTEAASAGPRIVGGQDAYAGQFPYVAAITVETANSRSFCGGALLKDQWVLTSGHCAYNGVLFTIQLGANSLTENDTNRVTVASSEYFLHPDFQPNALDNDIALIRLRMPVTMTTYIQQIDLPNFGLSNYTTVTLLGWGHTSDYDTELSDTLKFVYVVSIPNIECQMVYGTQISENMVCAQGNYNQGICTGDSGGALIEYLGRYPRVVGIASFVSGNGCESTDPSGYTRTWPYYDWIMNVVENNS